MLCGQRNVIALTVSGGYKLLDATRKRTTGEYTDMGIIHCSDNLSRRKQEQPLTVAGFRVIWMTAIKMPYGSLNEDGAGLVITSAVRIGGARIMKL